MLLRAIGLTLLALFRLRAQDVPVSSDSEHLKAAEAIPEAPALLSCPAGSPLGAVDLRVRSPRGGDQPLPFQTINHLSEGDTLVYAPILHGKEKRPGEIALVMVPAQRRQGQEPLMVTDPKPADKAQEWKMTQTVSLAAFVYGPQGLSKKKVRSFLSQDDLLIAQLADYADKTAQAESLVAALSNSESSSVSVNAALTGFASQYGFAVQIDKSAPAAAQAEALFASMNPQLATYNPLASSMAARAGQTASLATAAATLFFGNPVGLAAGGTAMLLDLRNIAFPDTQFRSSFAQPLAKPNSGLAKPNSGLDLCGQRGPAPPHTRVAFIWATRIPNEPTPAIHITDANFIPATQKTPVPVDVPAAEWKYLQRARNWALVDDKKQKIAVPVLKLGNQKSVEIDLSKANLSPGDYHLTGYWDWAPFEATGEVHVRPLSDFKQAKLEAASQDQLLARAGKVPVTVTGSDFEFTTKVELKKVNDEFATAEPLRFILPKGLREGPQEHMDVQINTADLDPGRYQLLVSQADDKSHAVAFNILPNPPKVENFPILANQGAAVQHYVLKGERLALLAKLEAPGAILDLSAPITGESKGESERNVTVQLKSDPKPGTALPIKAYLEDRSEPLTFADALQITGPLPVIASSKLSLPTGMGIALGKDEFPAGYMLSAMLDVKNMGRRSVLLLGCSDDVGQSTSLRIGEQTSKSNLQQLSADQLFLSVDTSSFPAGCSLQAVIDNGRDGKSQPFPLAQIIRMPQVETFALSDGQDGQPQGGTRAYMLTGQNLEMIQKVGWDSDDGMDVPALPAPIPGQGQRQSLEVRLPDPPAPQPFLHVWLRGDKEGRASTVKAPALSAAASVNAGGAGAKGQSLKPARKTPATPLNAEPHATSGETSTPPNVL